MKRVSLTAFTILLSAALPGARAVAQETNPSDTDEKCAGPVYEMSEVSRRARITHKPDPGFTEEARANDVSGVVSLTAVLCHTSRVTNIQVLKGLPFGLTERAVEAARKAEFTPAERGGQRVSQYVRFDYNFNTYGGKLIASGDQQNRLLVEEVIIEGNRRLRDEDIYYHIETRPGNRYEEVQVRRDLQALLAMPFFDKAETRVSIESGTRGGMVVIFTVKELPIIRDISFSGLRGVKHSDALKALRENRVGVCLECVYDPVKVTGAKEVIRKLLAARGWPNATVEVQFDELSAVSVALSFIININE